MSETFPYSHLIKISPQMKTYWNNTMLVGIFKVYDQFFLFLFFLVEGVC